MSAEQYEAVSARVIDRVKTWLRRALIVSEADSVSLFSIIRTREPVRITTIPMAGNTEPEDVAKELALLMQEDEDATAFRLVATNHGNVAAELTIRPPGRKSIAGNDGKDGIAPFKYDGRDSFYEQIGRHNEVMQRMMVASAEARDAMWRDMCDRLMTQNGTLMAQAMEDARERLSLIRQEKQAEAELLIARTQAAAMADTAAAVTKLLPVAGEQFRDWAITKMGGTPPAVKALQPALEVMEALTPDQIVKLAEVLGPVQMGKLGKAMEAMIAAKKAAAEAEDAKAKGGNGSRNGAAVSTPKG